ANQERSSDRTAAAASNESIEAEVTSTLLERREIPSFSVSREARIAEAAYWRAERRGFIAGRELEDWLEAEREIDGDGPPRSGERS
ncbi:MAG: DUF2934 domain-containing protein, partial [Steroidobacteraceae bacterium]